MDVSPSTIWKGAWREGSYNEASPFEDSRLTMVMKPGRFLDPSSDEDLFVRISKRNGISAFCGWGENSLGFRISTNTSDDEVALETTPQLGNGCSNTSEHDEVPGGGIASSRQQTQVSNTPPV
eukprot:jgi/Undpi1/1670/HiC_scaffold_11.g05060.m1